MNNNKIIDEQKQKLLGRLVRALGANQSGLQPDFSFYLFIFRS